MSIGGLLNEQVYYATYDANTIELYEGFALLTQVEFTSTIAMPPIHVRL